MPVSSSLNRRVLSQSVIPRTTRRPEWSPRSEGSLLRRFAAPEARHIFLDVRDFFSLGTLSIKEQNHAAFLHASLPHP
jgi:hypothetical protein